MRGRTCDRAVSQEMFFKTCSSFWIFVLFSLAELCDVTAEIPVASGGKDESQPGRPQRPPLSSAHCALCVCVFFFFSNITKGVNNPPIPLKVLSLTSQGKKRVDTLIARCLPKTR